MLGHRKNEFEFIFLIGTGFESDSDSKLEPGSNFLIIKNPSEK